MINERALKDVLVAIVEDNRGHFISISALLAEVAALRETVRGLDLTFADVLEHQRDESEERGAEITQYVLREYDELIRRLNQGEIC